LLIVCLDAFGVLQKLLLIDNFRPTKDYKDREVQVYIDENDDGEFFTTNVIRILPSFLNLLLYSLPHL